MSYFATSDPTRALRVALVGAGQMGRTWLRLIERVSDVELVAVVDVDVRAASVAVQDVCSRSVPTFADLSGALDEHSVDAVINVTVPEAHYDISRACVALGIPILCEKPLVPSLVDAYLLAGAAEHHRTLVMASQSRRYYRHLSDLRASAEVIGGASLVTVQFHRDPHFGGFRETMAHPLLLDMAIHAFDAARFVTGAEPISVHCESFNPPWSWFDGDAEAWAVFTLSGGSRFVYTGSWCSGGLVTSWNGTWRVVGPHGSATWDGLGPPVVEHAAGSGPLACDVRPERSTDLEDTEEIAGALAEFVHAVRTGEVPSGDIHSNLWSLAMVQAAVDSTEARQTVMVADLLDKAYREALLSDDAVAVGALERWSDCLDRLERSPHVMSDAVT